MEQKRAEEIQKEAFYGETLDGPGDPAMIALPMKTTRVLTDAEMARAVGGLTMSSDDQ